MRKCIIGFLAIISLISVSIPNASADGMYTPKFYCQVAGDYDGGRWGLERNGVPTSKLNHIADSGCGISCVASVSFNRTAHIFDERYNEWRDAYADPYVAYRANGDTTYVDWGRMVQEFGWKDIYYTNLDSYSEGQKADIIASLIADLKKPIAYISSGHFVTFVMTDLIGPYSGDELLAISRSEKYAPFADTVYDLDKSNSSIQKAGPYDNHFWIHDPGTKNGNYIYFSDNIKGARINDLSSVRAFHKY